MDIQNITVLHGDLLWIKSWSRPLKFWLNNSSVPAVTIKALYLMYRPDCVLEIIATNVVKNNTYKVVWHIASYYATAVVIL